MKWRYFGFKKWYLYLIPKFWYSWLEYNQSNDEYLIYYCYRWLCWTFDRLA